MCPWITYFCLVHLTLSDVLILQLNLVRICCPFLGPEVEDQKQPRKRD